MCKQTLMGFWQKFFIFHRCDIMNSALFTLGPQKQFWALKMLLTHEYLHLVPQHALVTSTFETQKWWKLCCCRRNVNDLLVRNPFCTIIFALCLLRCCEQKLSLTNALGYDARPILWVDHPVVILQCVHGLQNWAYASYVVVDLCVAYELGS